MKTAFLIIGGFLSIAAVAPYIRDVIARKTKPRIVSWFNWSLLTGIATAAAIADKQYPSAVLTATGALATMLVVIFGLRCGDRKFEVFDVLCQLGALTGLILWVIFKQPWVAITATVVIDFIATLPTLKHAWQKPHEETLSAFTLSMIGGIFTLLATTQARISGLLFPVYIVFINATLVAILKGRRANRGRRASGNNSQSSAR